MNFVSTHGAAQLLGVSDATVKRWADSGILQCFRTRGGHRKFRVVDINALVARRPLDGSSPDDQATPPASLGSNGVGEAAVPAETAHASEHRDSLTE